MSLTGKRLLKIKTGKSRIFEIQPHLAQLKQQARDLLLSPEGIELRVNRSCQVEGAFGVLKQNMQYTRFRRRALDRVTVEFALTCLGMNIRKYLRFSMKNSLPFYWKAPEGLASETFTDVIGVLSKTRVNKDNCQLFSRKFGLVNQGHEAPLSYQEIKVTNPL